jgi:cell division protein FtsA
MTKPKPLPSLIAVIDIGTHKTVGLLGQVIDGKARMLSFSERRTDGVVKGTVVDLERLHDCVHEVVNDLERGAQRGIEEVYLTITGPAVAGERVKGFVAVPAHDGKVTAKDLNEAVQSAKRLEPPAGRATILYMRQPTMLDGKIVENPVGLQGKRLEVNFWRVTMEEGNVRFRVNMINAMSIHVRDFILGAHASACALIGEPEKQGGALVVDCGAGTTDWILYFKGHILCAGSIPVGGEHLTNDLSVALRVSRDTAEDLKVRFGSGLHRETDVNQTIWKDGDKGVGDQQFNRGTITQVASLRFQETMEFVRKDVLHQLEQIFPGHAVKLDQNFLAAGAILTGGTANLADAAEAAQLALGLPTRVGVPPFEKEIYRKPEYAAVIGMMKAAIEDAPPPVRRPQGFLAWLKDMFRFS